MQNTIKHIQKTYKLNNEIIKYLEDFSLHIDHSDLYLAIVESGPEKIEQLLSLGFPIDHKNENGDTLLLVSIEFSTDESSVYLINHGANVNAINENEYSVFLIASANNNYEVLDLLLSKGADINNGMINNLNPLDYALSSNMTLRKYNYLKANGAKSNFNIFWTIKKLLVYFLYKQTKLFMITVWYHNKYRAGKEIKVSTQHAV